MKRSSALNTLKLLYVDYLDLKGFEKSQLNIEQIDELIELMLNKMERLGMLPPETWRPMDWNKTGITYAQWISLPSKINKWEPEHE